jgi:hypothetical protein
MESKQTVGMAIEAFVGAVLGVIVARMTVGPGLGAFVRIAIGVAIGVVLGEA